MARQNVLYDRKAEPGTLLGSAILNADAIEAFGQARDMFGRNSGTMIRDRDFNRLCRTVVQRDVDDLALLAVFARIFDQVLEHLNQFVPVAQYLNLSLWQV